MKNLPVKINEVLEQSNITDLTKAEKIASSYAPLMNEVTEQMQVLKKLKKGNAEDVEKAKRIRLDLGKICSKASDQKKEDKDILLIETRFVDALFNTVNAAARLTQEEAKEIELHFEKIEAEKIVKLQADRAKEVAKYDVEDTIHLNLGTMSDDVWKNYLTGTKTNYEAKIAAEKKAEADRIAKEKADKAEQDRIKKENAALKAEAEAREKQVAKEKAENEARIEKNRKDREKRSTELQPYIIFIREYENMISLNESEYQKELVEIKKGANDHWEFERKEKEKNDKIAKDLKAKNEAEAKAKQDEIDRAEAELNKGDVAKVGDLITDLENLKSKYSFKSKVNQKKYADTCLLIDKVINHIKK